ncbi:microsomal glutathione S-transferase 1 [Prorops nasuta]|uniref:microsomal glutathione S-transferase 1 n=1 Tax=Prorops nasuta TaxID=863751 RepID=UPI0034CF7D7A
MVQIEPELLKLFGFWSSVLVIKLLLMPILTAQQRMKKKVFANPEDVAFTGKKAKLIYDDPDVERVRRAHLNDLENILPWFIITSIWITTSPSLYVAGLLIPIFVIARIVHTFSYAILAQQPTRAIAYFVALVPILYETVASLIYYM